MQVSKSGKINYRMPTRAGVFKLGPRLRRLSLDGIDGEDEKPKAIAMMLRKSPAGESTLAYIRDANLHFHGASGSLRYLNLFEMPATAYTIEEGPYELTTVGRMTPDGIRWSYFNKEREKTASPYIGVGNIPEYKERKGAWRGLEAKIYYEFRGRDIVFWTQSSSAKTKKTQETVAIPKSLGKLSKLIEYKSINEGSIETDVARFYLIGQGGMYEIDIEGLIEELTPFNSSRPVTTLEPATPEPTAPEPPNPPVVVKNPGATLWEFETGDDVRSFPTIGSDGTVYVGSNDNKLYAIKTDSKGLAKSPWPMRGQNARHTGRVMKK